MATLRELLETMMQRDGTDLHLTTNSPPMVRVDGDLQSVDFPPLNPADTKNLCYSVMTDRQKHLFEKDMELDFSFGIKGLARFRANVFNQRGAVAGAFRLIPYDIRDFKTLGLPIAVNDLCKKPRGLVLVTGPTGSGKSTTLASMVDKVNQDRRAHIVTIEDPIEYLHTHKGCVVNQRELNTDTHSFAAALKSVLRQDPDICQVGEMRDQETIALGLKIAETGHLTFATLHTNSAVQTINRIVDVFPAHQQAQIRTQLSFVLEAVLCQSLLPRMGGKGRALAVEVLVPTPAVRNLIREDKIHQIYSSMQSGQDRHGMQTFNQSLATLYAEKKISLQTALEVSPNVDELEDLIRRGTRTTRQMEAAGAGRSTR